MEHPKEIGDRSTLAIIFALRCQGHTIYVPFGENTRADLIVDRGHELRRVQCKTGRHRRRADEGARIATSQRTAQHQAKGIRFAAPYELAKIDLY